MPDDQSNTKARRKFLTWLWWFLGIVGLLELIGITASFLFSGKKDRENPVGGEIINAGLVKDFKPNTVTAFPRGRFYLVCIENGGFLALSRQCTHLGCTVPWVEGENKFICPCHASSYDIYGNVLSAPAPRPLDLHLIEIKNQTLLVDTGKRIRRSQFEESQVSYFKDRSAAHKRTEFGRFA